MDAGHVDVPGASGAGVGDTVPCSPPCKGADKLRSDVPLEQYIAECREASEAPIKRKYARLVSSRVPYSLHVAGEGGAHVEDGAVARAKTAEKTKGTDHDGNSESIVDALTAPADRVEPVGVVDTQHGSKGRVERNRQQALQQQSQRLCSNVCRGKACPYGDTCKYMHDVDAYLREKPEDLPGACPWLGTGVPSDGSGAGDEQGDSCPYGYGCRFYGAHRGFHSSGGGGADTVPNTLGTRADDDGRFWMDDGTIPSGEMVVVDVGRRVLRPMNEMGMDLRVALRKRAYDFSKVEEALVTLGISNKKKPGNKSKQNTGRSENKRKAEEGAEGGVERAPEGGIEDVAGRKARDHPRKVFDARGKTYLAPLTTVGNLPFRRLCKRFGADITCGEMAMGQNLIQGQHGEWALLKRHPEEDFFGVQVCGAHADTMAYCAQLIEENCDVDFVDINCGCPIDVVVKKGAGSAVLTKPKKLEEIVRGMTSILTCPVTIKMRKGFDDGHDLAHKLIPRLGAWGVSAAVLHGRSRKQRYSRPADWDYIQKTARENDGPCQVIGNGDVYGWQDHVKAVESGDVATTYVARGALIKPWIFTEIKEQRDWDISAGERLDVVRQFVRNGLEHWGSDTLGVENTRRFLLEWLSFAHRYIPSGLLEVLPQRSNWRPSAFVGRSDLETLLASPDPADWIKISTWFLGPTPNGYKFHAKHQAKSHATDGARGGGRVAGRGNEAQENG